MSPLPLHAPRAVTATLATAPVGAAAPAGLALAALAAAVVGVTVLAAAAPAPTVTARPRVRLAVAPATAVSAAVPVVPTVPEPAPPRPGRPPAPVAALAPDLAGGASAGPLTRAWPDAVPAGAAYARVAPVAPDPAVEQALARLRSAARTARDGVRPASAALAALDHALDQVGDPYVWGAVGPSAFDCSGLVMSSYRAAGVDLPRVSRDQFAAGGQHVAVDDLLPGDLVFFATAAWDPGVVHHVGMYVGDGLMVDAPRPGLHVRAEPVYAQGYVGAVRPVPALTVPTRNPDDERRHEPGGPPRRGADRGGTPPGRPAPAPRAPSTAPVPATTAPPPSAATPTTATPTTATPTAATPTAATPSAPAPDPAPTTVPTSASPSTPTPAPSTGPTLSDVLLAPPVLVATLATVPLAGTGG